MKLTLTTLLITFFWLPRAHTQAQTSSYVSPPGSIVEFDEDSTLKKPFYHYGKVRYYVFKAVDRDTFSMIKTVLENLPKGVKAIGYYRKNESIEKIKEKYEKEINYTGDLDFVEVDNSNPDIFWAKSAMPYPVENSGQWELVDHKYFLADFDPVKEFSDYFSLPVADYKFYFRGGNLAVNESGLCITVNAESKKMDKVPDQVFNQFYGCKRLMRLSHDKGIGDVNEVVKFVDDNTVITDQKKYVKKLKEAGLKVVEIMDANNMYAYASYVNASFVNGVAFVPTYNLESDSDALKIYENLGFQVVGVDSRKVVQWKGSIDCITATYPEMK